MKLQVSLFGILAGLSTGWAQQGTADAIVVKISSANIPSTVTLSTSGGRGVPGQSLSVPVTLSLLDTTRPGSFQVDLTFDSTKLTFVSAAGLTGNVISGNLRLSAANQDGIASGVVGSLTFSVAPSTGAGTTPLTFIDCQSADTLGNPLSTGCTGGTVELYTCDVTGDTNAGGDDVAAMINEALGVTRAAHDLNQDGVVNVADIQRVASAAAGQGCVY